MNQKDIVKKMTLEEKAAILSGRNVWQTREISRLGIPSVFLSDGPHGIRKQAGAGDHLGLNASLKATCFPTAATIANSWDTDLGERLGKALGEEAASMEVDILLGPGLNIKRSPLCGRNFEYFSEDPYLSGKMAAAYIRGIQSQGVYACPKHFAVNSQEQSRMVVDAVVDERTLRETYLTGFEIAVREGGAKAIMSSYNRVNGIYANENEHLLKEILRKEWGFDGIVVTDWGGSNDHVKGVAAGSNLEMPGSGLDSARELMAAVKSGELPEKSLDACVETLVKGILELKENRNGKKREADWEAHHELARQAALESTVLLKNEGGILPLDPGKTVALIGDFAFEPRYQGAGSSLVNPVRVETMAEQIENCGLTVAGTARGYLRNGKPDDGEFQKALALAEKADMVLYCFGLDEQCESEGKDRENMKVPQNQIALLEAISQVNPRIVGILSAGASVEMPWEPYCMAILHGYLNGQAGAAAMLDLVAGKANPCGHLSETYPLRYEDTPARFHCPSQKKTSEYRDGIYVGYGYYETAKVKVRYPFGYGLSYTEFSYGDLHTDREGVAFTVTNTGTMDGAEVAQLYIGLPEGKVFRPEKMLKGFRKIFLKRGESRQVRIPFDDKTFRYWNVKTNRWEIEEGVYRIMVGANVEDIRLAGEIAVAGTTKEYPYDQEKLPSYYAGCVSTVGDQEFETLLGRSIPKETRNENLDLNDAICQMEHAKSCLARFVYRRLTARKQASEKAGRPDLNILFIYNMPFRGIAKMTGGPVSMEMARGLVEAANGHFFKGMKMMLLGYVRNRRENRRYEALLGGQK